MFGREAQHKLEKWTQLHLTGFKKGGQLDWKLGKGGQLDWISTQWGVNQIEPGCLRGLRMLKRAQVFMSTYVTYIVHWVMVVFLLQIVSHTLTSFLLYRLLWHVYTYFIFGHLWWLTAFFVYLAPLQNPTFDILVCCSHKLCSHLYPVMNGLHKYSCLPSNVGHSSNLMYTQQRNFKIGAFLWYFSNLYIYLFHISYTYGMYVCIYF